MKNMNNIKMKFGANTYLIQLFRSKINEIKKNKIVNNNNS